VDPPTSSLLAALNVAISNCFLISDTRQQRNQIVNAFFRIELVTNRFGLHDKFMLA